MSLYIVQMMIKHDGCWSEVTNSLEGTTIVDLNLSVNPAQKITNASVMLNVPKHADLPTLKHFITYGKSERSVKKIVDLSNARNHSLSFVNFVGVYEGTIAAVLYEEGSPFFRYFFENGKENWTFTVYSNRQLDAIKERLAGMATIYTLYAEKVSDTSVAKIAGWESEHLLKAYMTGIQWRTLLSAYNNGYYETPRKTTTSGISEILHLSPSTVNSYLRHIEKKIMEMILRNH